MFELGVSHKINEISEKFGERARDQIPFATAKALTATALAVKQDEQREIHDVFDRPTPYTMNSLYVKPATKVDLVARTWLKEDSSSGIPAAKYLAAEIRGGGRALKAFEIRLRNKGILPDGYRAVPGSGADIDAYGNMSRGQIVQILSYFETADILGDYSNMSAKNRAAFGRRQARKMGAKDVQFFVGRPGDGRAPLGIWKRVKFSRGSSIKPVLIFVPHVQYKALFDFEYVARRAADREFPRQFEQALDEAMRTAR